jgi:hypothetical protein
MERPTRFELVSPPWRSGVLPLNDGRKWRHAPESHRAGRGLPPRAWMLARVAWCPRAESNSQGGFRKPAADSVGGDIGWKELAGQGSNLDSRGSGPRVLPSYTTRHGSGWKDSNLRPPASKAGTLAKLRYIQSNQFGNISMEPPLRIELGPPRYECGVQPFAPWRHDPHRETGAHREIRTLTVMGLSHVPLPVGVREREWRCGELEPRPSVCRTDVLPLSLHPPGGGTGNRTQRGRVMSPSQTPVSPQGG